MAREYQIGPTGAHSRAAVRQRDEEMARKVSQAQGLTADAPEGAPTSGGQLDPKYLQT